MSAGEIVLPDKIKKQQETNTENTGPRYLESDKVWEYVKEIEKEFAVSLKRLENA